MRSCGKGAIARSPFDSGVTPIRSRAATNSGVPASIHPYRMGSTRPEESLRGSSVESARSSSMTLFPSSGRALSTAVKWPGSGEYHSVRGNGYVSYRGGGRGFQSGR